jgi:hypothetical protein
MTFRPKHRQSASTAAPRRDVLGFFKSVVEFFTGMTGLAAACVGVLGTVATIIFISPGPPPQPRRYRTLRPGQRFLRRPAAQSVTSNRESRLTSVRIWLAAVRA